MWALGRGEEGLARAGRPGPGGPELSCCVSFIFFKFYIDSDFILFIYFLAVPCSM